MAYIIYTKETRTDPADTELVATEEEVLDAVKDIYEDEGIIPATVYLIDDYTDEEIEVEVADYLDIADLALITVEEIQL